MTIKNTFKSHFKLKKAFNFKKNKSILIKNILIYIFFSKIFLKNCKITLKFQNIKNSTINLLKAPSRHKKFFHQICTESFLTKIFYNFFKTRGEFLPQPLLFNYLVINNFFLNLHKFFQNIGSNVFNKIKTTISLGVLLQFDF